MADFSNSVMVALLPITTDWSKQDLPHLTLVYAGQRSELKPNDFNELAKEASSIALTNRTIQLAVVGPEIFGEEPERVDVLTLRPTPALRDMRQRVISWDFSNRPYVPHVTIGPVGSLAQLNGNIPPAIAFDRVYFGWGQESLNFKLRD